MIYAENILLCIASPLLLSLFFLRKTVRRFVGCILIGMGICLLSAYISGYMYQIVELEESETSIFISPIVEEIMKLLPLLFVLFLFEPDDRSFMDVGLGIGVGFATFENCCYILSSGAESLPYVLVRGLAVGVMHIVTMEAVSLALVMSRRYKMLSVPGIAGALTCSMIFHALYNLLVSEPGLSATIGYILPIIGAAGLYALHRANRQKQV